MKINLLITTIIKKFNSLINLIINKINIFKYKLLLIC
jgi:hypothetical protein